MRQLVQAGKFNYTIRDLANQLTASCAEKDWGAEIASIFEFVRSRIRYALDPFELELIQAPDQTLALGYGDCDDKSILLATLLECVGHPCAFMALGFGPIGDYSHVLVICCPAGEEDWVSLDTTEPNPPGWFPPGSTCDMVAPITQAAADLLAGG